jgi:tetratricopeptide (TPR) repeat protein
VELLGDKALPSGPPISEADKLFLQLVDDNLIKGLTAAIERNPENMERHWERGEWYARHARWKEAAADYTLVLERKPPTDAAWWLHAAPALAAGDRAAYRQLCREMLKRFGDTQDPTTAERIAKGCLLLPAADKDTERAYQLADRAVTLGKNHSYALYFVFCKGLADYRRGNVAATVAGLEPLPPRITSTIPNLAACCHLVLAMALHRQGQAKAAREHLGEGAKLLKQHIHDLDHFSMERSQYRHDWLIAWLLHREAEAMVKAK